MGPESADMFDRVTREVSNSNDPELGWKPVTKGKRSKKPAARNFNEITKVGNRTPKKLDGSVTRKLVSNGGGHIPPKKRRVLRTPSEPQSLALVKEDPVSPQPQTPSPHGDSKPQSKVLCKSSDVNSRNDRVDRAVISDDVDQKFLDTKDFSGISLLATAAGIDFMDDSSLLKAVEEHSIPENGGMSASVEPVKCSIYVEPHGSPSNMVKESTDTKCSTLCNGAALPQSMQVNEDVDVRELEALKVNRLHWDLNIEMDAWEKPLDISDHNPEAKMLRGEGCKVPAKSDYCHITEDNRPLIQIEQVSSAPENVTDGASVGISTLCPTESMNDLAGMKLSNLGSAMQSDQVSFAYVDGGTPGNTSEKITVVRETAKINQTSHFTDTEDSMQNIELPVLESSQHESNINSAVAAISQEVSYIPDNSGNNSPTKQPAQISPNYKDASISGASTQSGLCNPKGQASSVFVPVTTVIEGDVLPCLSTKNDESQSYDPTGSAAKVGSSLDDCRCSDVSQGDGSNTVGSKDMTGIQDGNDSPYEDGELRLSMPCPWVETESDNRYNECVDYESDGADYPGSEVVEGGSDGSLGVEKQSVSVREASLPQLNLSGSPKRCMKADVELGGAMDKSKVEYSMHDNNLRRRQYGIETKGSHLEEMNSRTKRMNSHSHFEGSQCLDVMEKTNIGYLQQNSRSHVYSRPTRDVSPQTFVGRQRSHFHVRERNEEDDQWSGHWGSRSRNSSGYRDPAGHIYNRPRNMTAESEKFSELNSQDRRQSMQYSSKAPFRGDNRRLPYEKDDYHHVRNRTAANTNWSMGNSGNYTQGVSRGDRNDGYDPSHENRTLSSNRVPHYLSRPEPSYSPTSARPAGLSQNFIPRKRFRSSSRSRSRSPRGDRRYTRSPDFKSPARVDRVRMPFKKPNFPADHPGSVRGHYSPQRNRRWVDDRNFVENSLHRSSPVGVSERTGRFNSAGPDGRHKEDNYFRPGNRPGRFPPVAGAGRGHNFGEKYNDRRNDRIDSMHRTRHLDANIAVGRCKDDQEDNFDGSIMRKDDDTRNAEHRDVARSSREDRRSFKE